MEQYTSSSQAENHEAVSNQAINIVNKPNYKLLLLVAFSITALLIILYLIISQAPQLPVSQLPLNILPTPTTQSTPHPNSPSNLLTYTNSTYDFSFNYPNTFSPVPHSSTTTYGEHLISLFDENAKVRFDVYFNSNNFSLEYLKKFAPTGSENIAPSPKKVGEFNFYYYGAGGGGVSYPDQYFVNLEDKILIFIFDGPYDGDKSPTIESQSIQTKLLESLTTLHSPIVSTWKTYSDTPYTFTIQHPSNWLLTQTKDREGNHMIKIAPNTAAKSAFSVRKLPEIYIGIENPYSTSGAICSNQSCTQTSNPLIVTINNQKLSIPITKAEVITNGTTQFDYYAFSFSLPEKKLTVKTHTEPVDLSVTSSFISFEEQEIIAKIISSISYNQN